MSDFTLDDVEETFRDDMRAVLLRVGRAAPAIALPLGDGISEDLLARQLAFGTLAECSHAIKGTASLVGTKALADLALYVEELAERGRDAIRIARVHLERARSMGALCTRGSALFSETIALEVARDGAGASKLVEALIEQAHQALDRDDSFTELMRQGSDAADAELQALAPAAAAGIASEPPALAAAASTNAAPFGDEDDMRALDDAFAALVDEPVPAAAAGRALGAANPSPLPPRSATQSPGKSTMSLRGRDAHLQAFRAEAAAVSNSVGRLLLRVARGIGAIEARATMAPLMEALFAAAHAFDSELAAPLIADARVHFAPILQGEGATEMQVGSALHSINALLRLGGAPIAEASSASLQPGRLSSIPAAMLAARASLQARAVLDTAAVARISLISGAVTLEPGAIDSLPPDGARIEVLGLPTAAEAAATAPAAATAAGVPVADGAAADFAADDELAAILRDELAEQFPSIERALMVMKAANDAVLGEEAESLRKRMHSLKGAAATVGKEAIQRSAEAAERELRRLVSGSASGSNPLQVLDSLSRIANAINKMFELATLPHRVPVISAAGESSSFLTGAAMDALGGGFDSVLLDAELIEVFQLELHDVAPGVRALVASLHQDPSVTREWDALKRVLHQLKGAAATVGLAELATAGGQLQVTAHEYSQKGASAAEFAAFRTALEAFFVNAGLALGDVAGDSAHAGDAARAGNAPAGAPVGAYDAALSSDDEEAAAATRALFLEEMARTGELLQKLQSEYRITTPKERSLLLSEAREIVHRVAGSARTMHDVGLARGATALDGFLSTVNAGDAATVSAVSERLKAFVQLLTGGVVPAVSSPAFTIPPAAAGAARALTLSAPPKMARDARAALAAEAALAAIADQSGKGEQFVSVEVYDSPELWEAFLIECSELFEELDNLALGLERSTNPKVEIKHALRAVHTLKGAVNTMQLLPTGALLHDAEDFLEQLDTRPLLPPPPAIASVLIAVVALTRKNVEQGQSGKLTLPNPKIRSEFARLLGIHLTAGAASERAAHVGSEPSFGSAEPYGDSQADASASQSGQSAANSSSGSSANASGRRKEVQLVRVATKRLDSLMGFASELVINRSRVAMRVSKLRGIASGLDQSRRQLFSAVESFRDDHEFSAARVQQRSAFEGNFDGNAARVPAAAGSGFATRFGALELDEYNDVEILARRVGEVGNDFEALFRQFGEELRELGEDTDGFGALVRGIQTEVTQARLTPLELLFNRLRLPIRDAAARGRVVVDVQTEGANTLIDKTLADALYAPLLHVVRNAVAHGIESPGKRAQVGKPEAGALKLRGREDSGEVVIEIEDDGRGLDLHALRERGARLGLVDANISLDDPRVRDLMFASGLSTREAADDVAGRGLGGDIVKRVVERLSGSVEVESVANKGTLLRIRLPASLAITKVLRVDTGKRQFALPMFFAERILERGDAQLTVDGTGSFAKVDGELLRAFNLAELTHTRSSEHTADEAVVVLRVGAVRFCLTVQRVLGQEDAVVKSLGELLAGHPLFSGVTIRGDGQLLLVLDIPNIAERTRAATGARPALGWRANPGKTAPKRDAEAGPVDLAAKPGEAAPAAPAAAAAAAGGRTSVRSGTLRILYVDDSLSVRKVAERMLTQMGAEVTLAVDGVDGLEKLRAGEFDIVFSDIEMPRMHGYDLLREIRFVPAYRDLPVIIVTSRSGAKHREEATQAGASAYLTKPFNKQGVEEILAQWVRKAK